MAKNAPTGRESEVRQVMDTSLDMVDVPLESSVNANQGNLGNTVIKDFEVRSLSSPGLPFKIISE